MATEEPYFQVAPCCRPGDIGKTHIPYLHQLDLEFPFDAKSKCEEAAHNVSNIIRESIENSLKGRITRIIDMTYDEAMSQYGTDSPGIINDDRSFTLTIVRNPPLFLVGNNGEFDTTILPMAQPIWPDEETALAFKNGLLSPQELKHVRVYGYDFSLSSAVFNKQNGDDIEGIEVAGGSVRIKDPEIQRRILNFVRPGPYSGEIEPGFLPLIALLEYYQDTGCFTAGGAIGMERLAMAAAEVEHIKDIVSLPWVNGEPLFLSSVKKERQKMNELRVVLHGGDGKLSEQLSQVTRVLRESSEDQLMEGNKIGYVAVALEPLVGDGKPIPAGGIESTFKSTIQPFFADEGVSSTPFFRHQFLKTNKIISSRKSVSKVILGSEGVAIIVRRGAWGETHNLWRSC